MQFLLDLLHFQGKSQSRPRIRRLGQAVLHQHPPVRIGDHAHITKFKSGKVATVSELAQKVKQERAFLFRALSLVNLAPDIIEAILHGKEPSSLTLSKLRKGVPEDWTEQRKLFGME